MFSDLMGKRALVTGACGGLGAEFASTLAGAGVSLILTDMHADATEQVNEIRSKRVDCHYLPCDVTRAIDVDKTMARAVELLGGIDVLVNNAGVAPMKPSLEVIDSEWRAVIDINLGGVWRMARAAALHMKEAGHGGSIVNLASIVAIRSTKQVAAYAASKAAVAHLTHVLALEWAVHGIRVNAIAPGYIATAINADYFSTAAGKSLIKRIPQRRVGQPADLAGLLLLLASDASSFITGAVIPVDGGHLVSSL